MSHELSVHCPRLGKDRTVEKHAECPYCFGKAGDVAPGERPRFCDFQPGEDPVTFGFPTDTTRNRAG
jgi:hypothetical protein